MSYNSEKEISQNVFDSVATAINLKTARDENPELDQVISLDQVSKTKINEVDKIKEEVPKIPENEVNLTNQSDNNETEIIQDTAMTIRLTNMLALAEKTDISPEDNILCRAVEKPFIKPSLDPPNNGMKVISIDQLIDPLKMGAMTSMISSIPSIRDKLSPSLIEACQTANARLTPDKLSKSPSINNIATMQPINPQSTPTQPPTQPPLPQPQTPTQPLPQPPTQPPILKLIMDPNINQNIIQGSGKIVLRIKNPEKPLDMTNVVEDRPEISQNWTLIDIITKAVPPGWKPIFESCHHEFIDIARILGEQERAYGMYYPLKKDLFKAFDMCPLENVKVVIIGQDPYHSTDYTGYPIAKGMSFSVSKNSQIPSSLRNIYKEIEQSVRGWNRPNHGDLSEWAKQGILLLNTCLTVRPGAAASHGDIWMGFVTKVIKAISTVNPTCIYVLWGRKAERLSSHLTGKNIILTSPHPSGFSANKGFIGCNHFVKINEQLEKDGKSAINWQIT